MRDGDGPEVRDGGQGRLQERDRGAVQVRGIKLSIPGILNAADIKFSDDY